MANLCLKCFHYRDGKCVAIKGQYCKILNDRI